MTVPKRPAPDVNAVLTPGERDYVLRRVDELRFHNHEEVAVAIGISRSLFSKIVSGTRKAKPLVRRRLLEVLDADAPPDTNSAAAGQSPPNGGENAVYTGTAGSDVAGFLPGYRLYPAYERGIGVDPRDSTPGPTLRLTHGWVSVTMNDARKIGDGYAVVMDGNQLSNWGHEGGFVRAGWVLYCSPARLTDDQGLPKPLTRLLEKLVAVYDPDDGLQVGELHRAPGHSGDNDERWQLVTNSAELPEERRDIEPGWVLGEIVLMQPPSYAPVNFSKGRSASGVPAEPPRGIEPQRRRAG